MLKPLKVKVKKKTLDKNTEQLVALEVSTKQFAAVILVCLSLHNENFVFYYILF